MNNFFDAKDFKYTSLLESNATVILNELKHLMHPNSEEKSLIAAWLAVHPHYVNGEHQVSWKTFEFKFFGIKNRNNCKLCPKTTEIIEQIPELITAQFSVLMPHTHIKPHKGYSKIIVRNHLPLIVPNGDKCAIRVGNEIHYWKKNQLVIFDDSIEHEAWNKSDEIRVVLMFDIAKPDCGYNAQQICKYKIENMDDPFLLNIASKDQWMSWFLKGEFDTNLNP